MQVEGRGDHRFRPDRRAHPPRQFGFGPRHTADRHRAMQREIDAVERTFGLQPFDHLSGQRLEGFLGDPARAHVGLRP
jgi:hypothetical protein